MIKLIVFHKRPLALILLCLLTLAALSLALSPVYAAKNQESFIPPYMEQLEAYRNRTLENLRQETEPPKENKEEPRLLSEAIKTHTIKRGETLGEIARYYGVKVQHLALWNNLANPDLIREGEVIRVLSVNSLLHQELKEKAEKELPTIALASRGETQVPVFRWPLQGNITSYYGLRDGGFHYGLDIAAPYGNEIRSAAPGIVDFSGRQRGYGLMLTIDHGNGWSTLYAHNSRLLVKEGQRVGSGQPIALVGVSGNATGPHLHLEIIHQDKKLDPLKYLP